MLDQSIFDCQLLEINHDSSQELTIEKIRVKVSNINLNVVSSMNDAYNFLTEIKCFCVGSCKDISSMDDADIFLNQNTRHAIIC